MQTKFAQTLTKTKNRFEDTLKVALFLIPKMRAIKIKRGHNYSCFYLVY
jgi:hypothetical protein